MLSVRSLRRQVRTLRRQIENREKSPRHDRPANLPLLDWTRRYLSNVITCQPSTFHEWLVEELDTLKSRRNARLSVQAPRGSAKSTFASLAYPLREALEGRERFIAICSDSGDQAKDFMEAIRTQLEENETIRRDYPEASGRGRIWRDKRIRLRNGCEIIALGSGGKIRGRKSAENRRPTLVLLDDPQNKDHIFSETKRARAWEWLTKDVLSAGEPGTNVVVLGTALHREAIVCQLETTAGWQSRKWQSIVSWPARMDLWREWEGLLHDYSKETSQERDEQALAFYLAHKADMDEGAVVLWPDRWSLYYLMTKRASDGHSAFNSEEQNDPISPESCEWAAEYLDHPAMWFSEWPADLVVKTMAIDPSKGRHSNKGDYSAIILYGRARNGLEYFEADVRRRTSDAICEDAVRLYRDFNPAGIMVETLVFQELLLPMLQDAARRAGLAELRTYRCEDMADKDVRIRRLNKPIVTKAARFKSRSPGTMKLVEQLRVFPQGTYDDAPDAAEMSRRLAIDLFNNKAARR